jgi:hypothetical protein
VIKAARHQTTCARQQKYQKTTIAARNNYLLLGDSRFRHVSRGTVALAAGVGSAEGNAAICINLRTVSVIMTTRF